MHRGWTLPLFGTLTVERYVPLANNELQENYFPLALGCGAGGCSGQS
jgi:hypothetical protein